MGASTAGAVRGGGRAVVFPLRVNDFLGMPCIEGLVTHDFVSDDGPGATLHMPYAEHMPHAGHMQHAGQKARNVVKLNRRVWGRGRPILPDRVSPRAELHSSGAADCQ